MGLLGKERPDFSRTLGAGPNYKEDFAFQGLQPGDIQRVDSGPIGLAREWCIVSQIHCQLPVAHSFFDPTCVGRDQNQDNTKSLGNFT